MNACGKAWAFTDDSNMPFCKRRQTALQKAVNCNAKGHFSEGERWPFRKHEKSRYIGSGVSVKTMKPIF